MPITRILIIGNTAKYIRTDHQNNIWIGACQTGDEHLLAPTPEGKDRRDCCKMISVEDIVKMLGGV